MELNCPVKTYAWGKKGSDSLVAQLKRNANHDFEVDEDETYAELWMGTHCGGPAVIRHSNEPLDDWLKNNTSKLGETVIKLYGSELPFLFKVLSVNMPLSIQVHPSKEQATELHSKFPDIYKDPNHKPEMAIALSDFEVLCGFRPIYHIRRFLKSIPELVELIGSVRASVFLQCNESEEIEHLAQIFESLMKAPSTAVILYLDKFMKRMDKLDSNAQNDISYELFRRIHKYYPGDVGCFCIYFLNHLILKPDEAIFLPANEPHAYIHGDCIECMAKSDNVIRAALTPKFRDVDMLCKLLNYSPSEGESKKLGLCKENDNSTLYKGPAGEFASCKVEVKPGLHYDLKSRPSGSIFLVLRGKGTIDDEEIEQGRIYFVGANEVHTLKVSSSIDETLALFQAFANV